MHDALQQCEHEVEQARSKLSHDLATLRAPETVSSFTDDLKRGAIETKDTLILEAKHAAQSKLTEFVEDWKAKAAANPAAVLAVGAGIAWRLLRNPPIAAALIGGGLYSLWRTDGFRRQHRSNADYFQAGKERLKEQAGDLAAGAKEVAADVGEAVTAKTAEMIEAAKAKAEQWSHDVGRSAAAAGAALRTEAASAAAKAGDAARNVSARAEDAAANVSARATKAFQDTVSAGQGVIADAPSRDTLLLGVAGVAVAAALGIACQKRIAEDVG